MYVLLGIEYGGLPDEIPNKFNFKGEIKSYTSKAVLFIFPIISTLTFLVLFGCCFIPMIIWKILEKFDILKDLKDAINHAWITYMIGTSASVCAFLAYFLVVMIYASFRGYSLLIAITLFILVNLVLNIGVPILLIFKIKPLFNKEMVGLEFSSLS